MKASFRCAALALGALSAGCGGTYMLAPSDSRTAYVVKKTLLGTNVLHCQAKEGPNPDPVCTEVRETRSGGTR